MFVTLHPAYTFHVVIHDRETPQQSFSGVAGGVPAPYNGHKFADEHNGKSGCDEALKALREALAVAGIQADVTLEKFDRQP